MAAKNKIIIGKDTSFFDKYTISDIEFPEQCQAIININTINNLFLQLRGIISLNILLMVRRFMVI